jgi:heme exporter protein CcmD
MMDFGKHALFIWASYGVAMGGLLLLTISSWRAMRKAEAVVAALKRDRRG